MNLVEGRLRVYLDNCCYNRPYDNQAQLRISLETQAKLFIQEQIILGRIDLISSYVLNAENSMNRILSKRESIKHFMDENTKGYVSAIHKQEIEAMAAEITKDGVKFMDACHVACALFAECDYLLSTDDRLLKYKNDGIKILNPIIFLQEMER